MAKDRKKLGEHEEMLPVKLTDSELLERAKKVGAVTNELNVHLLEADGVRKRLKAKEAELEEQRQRLAHMLFTGAEARKTRVEAYANFANNKFEEVRLDTGEVITRRPLEPDERQGEFDLDLWREDFHRRQIDKDRADVAKLRANDKDEEEPN